VLTDIPGSDTIGGHN